MDYSVLEDIALRAVLRLQAGRLDAVVDEVGYALAFDRPPALALRHDIAACLSGIGPDVRMHERATPETRVLTLAPNNTGLVGIIECRVPLTNTHAQLLVEFVVTQPHGETWLTLEQVSVA